MCLTKTKLSNKNVFTGSSEYERQLKKAVKKGDFGKDRNGKDYYTDKDIVTFTGRIKTRSTSHKYL